MGLFEPAPILASASSAARPATSELSGASASDAAPDAASEEGATRGDTTLDADAFRSFYERTSAPLRRYLLRVAGDPALAEDVFQESYVRLINGPALGAEANRRAYLFRIATNLLRDHWRREKREQRGLLDFLSIRRQQDLRASSVPPADRGLDLEAALATLEPRQRAMLWLAYVEGYRHREIAAMLGLKKNSVKVLLFRLRRRLAEQLDAGSSE